MFHDMRAERSVAASVALPVTRVGSLLERDREVATLDALIRDARGGVAGVAGIEGAAGIGKTRLIAEARRRAAEGGFRVLSAQASELEHDFPFGVVRQLFEACAAEEPARVLRGSASPASSIVGLADGRDPDQPAGDTSFAALHALYWVTVNLSEDRPLLLAVDDLQWCDPSSLRFLSYLAVRLEGLPALLVYSRRAGDQDPLLAPILGLPATVPIRPRELSATAAAALARERLGESVETVFSDACHRATGGNPLLLNELLKTLAAEAVRPDSAHLSVVEELGPRAVSRAVFVRLARLSDDAARVGKALAVLGDGADLYAVAAVAEIDAGRAGRAVSELVRSEILRPEPPAGFVHPLIAAAIYRDIPSGERDLQHQRAAELLHAAGASSEQVAGHLLLAPARGEPRVVETLAGAAARALRNGAPDSAVAYLARAVAEPPAPERRGELLLALGRAEALTSLPDAVEHLRRAYESLEDPGQRGEAAGLLARALLFTGFPDDAAALARGAAAALPGDLHDQRVALEAFESFCVLFGAGDRDALLRLERHRALPVGDSIGAKMLASIAAQHWMYAGGPSDAVSELSLGALAGGDLIAADNGLLANCAITNLTFADREEAASWWEVARTDAHRRGSLVAMLSISLWGGNTLHWRGDLIEAEQSLRTGLADLGQWGYGQDQVHIYFHAHLSSVLRERGDLAAARAVLQSSVDPGTDDDGARYWLASQIELLLAEGRFEPALVAADDYSRRFEPVIRNPMDAPWRSLKALALDRLGRREESLELLAEELELARRWGAPGTICRTLRALGMTLREDGPEHLEQAVTVVAGSPARLEHAKSLAAWGAALRRTGQRADAREPLRAALELAEACGADALALQIRSELYAAGARPRPTALGGVESLTASERRVAALARDGRTNREIAETLFVTPKTVEMHLGNVYRKLGVNSRRQLPGILPG